jgi:HEAT repeat protein
MLSLAVNMADGIDQDPINILASLSGGDRRSTGRSDEIVAVVLADPALFGRLIEGMSDPDPLIRMRAADAAEKVTLQRPELLQPFKEQLLDQMSPVEQQEVRWHVAQMLPRLELSPTERLQALDILLGYLDDESKIVKTFAMQGLSDMAQQDPTLRDEVIPVLVELTASGSSAMRSRGRQLLKQLGMEV